MKPVAEIIKSINLSDNASIQNAVHEAINDNGVTSGARVAVVEDPTYPFDGCVGKVKGINGGFADVEFDNGIKAKLHINLLIPV